MQQKSFDLQNQAQILLSASFLVGYSTAGAPPFKGTDTDPLSPALTGVQLITSVSSVPDS